MYYEYFGLRDAPFQFLPSNTLFLSDAHIEGLAALEWAFQEPSGLTLLAGEVGTGKTMLIHALVTRLNDNKVRVAQLSNPTMSFEEMLDVIVQQLGIHPAGKSKLAALQALKTFVSDPASTDRVILIFDEAQGLSDGTLEELRLLSNSRPPQRHALQIILVGQPELVQRLSEPKLRALNQRIGARALLRPLRGGEVSEYVNCLLRAQGADREIFTGEAMRQIARLSGGLPRKINNLCHNALFQAYSERSTMVGAKHVQAASAELENLLGAPGGRDDYTAERMRGTARRTLVRNKPLLAGGLVAVAVVAGIMILGHGRDRTDVGINRAATPQTDRQQGAGDSGKHRLASSSDGDEAEHQTSAAAPMPTGQTPNATAQQQPATQARWPVEQTPQTTAQASESVVQGPLPAAPKPPADGGAGTVVARGTTLPESATAPGISYRLTYAQQRRLQYEIKRSRSSFEDGRYRNAIFHLKRALLLDPDNAEMRDLLQRSQAALNPGTSAPVSDVSAPAAADAPGPAADQGLKTTDIPAPAPHGSNFSGVVRDEISAGDAYMRAGKYDLALRKFLTAAVLDPDNQNVNERIARARGAKAVMEGPSDHPAANTSPADSSAGP
ncbi:MAG TPA: AAA family ATPase [Candidatus Binataceae bacterium]|nr:AAA family ATPase [Candidatus Binataceae bacterium]